MSVSQAALDALEQQAKALEAIAKQTLQDLNTVAGTERLTKWQAATTALLKQHGSEKIAMSFSLTKPGPSFTNDLVEEFSEDVDVYRNALKAARKAVETQLTAAAKAKPAG
ncbi:MAG: hypothetical protein U0172_08950 [Nitrospiraceae bacterium]